MGIWHWQVSSLRDTSRQRLIFFARSLESLLDKYEHLPFMISLHDRAVALLHQQNVELVQQMNLWLSQAQNGTDVSQSYVLDASGTAVASSEPLLLGSLPTVLPAGSEWAGHHVLQHWYHYGSARWISCTAHLA